MSASTVEAKKDAGAGYALLATPISAPVVGAVYCATALLDAWVARLVWTWLLTPAYGIPAPSYGVFIALDALLALYVKSRVRRAGATLSDAVGAVLVFPLSILCAAYFLTHWLGVR